MLLLFNFLMFLNNTSSWLLGLGCYIINGTHKQSYILLVQHTGFLENTHGSAAALDCSTVNTLFGFVDSRTV